MRPASKRHASSKRQLLGVLEMRPVRKESLHNRHDQRRTCSCVAECPETRSLS